MPRKAGSEALSCWLEYKGDLWKEIYDFHLPYLDPGVSRNCGLLVAALRVLGIGGGSWRFAIIGGEAFWHLEITLQVAAILLSNYLGEGRLAEMAGWIAGFIYKQC